MSKGTYLGKEGKVFGPYTPEEVEEMKMTGQYNDFTWIWSEEEGGWKTLLAPPSAPPAFKDEKAKPEKQTSPMRGAAHKKERETVSSHKYKADRYQVICHNNHKLLSGQLFEASDAFGKFGTQCGDNLPVFRKGSKVFLNLLDEDSGKGENITAIVGNCQRTNGFWVYEVRWTQTPVIFSKVKSA